MTKIAIFASGAGSNAEKIIAASLATGSKDLNLPVSVATYRVSLVVCNKPGAGVLAIAKKHGIPALVIEKERFIHADSYIPELKKYQIEFIVLAGFLWMIPPALIQAYPKKIINIHPALLPKFGGKGMYGDKVHEAVIASQEPESGITIHYVDELYDHGEIIFQAKCPVTAQDNAATLAKKIHALEHAHYPQIITRLV